MQHWKTLVGIAGALVGLGSGCSQATDSPAVEFGAGSGQPIGRWAADGSGQSQAGGAVLPAGTSMGAIGPTTGTAGVGSIGPAGGFAPPLGGAAATSGGIATGGRGGSVPGTGVSTAGTGSMVAGNAGGGGATGGMTAGGSTVPPTESAVTSVAFDVTTQPQGGRYQPRNIGAIWVQDASGKFVKSLEVWARIRARYLTKYASARGGQPVDVTASATLRSHVAHHVTWDMKDRSGATAPAGKYTINIEVTDADRSGQSHSVQFDTSMGPQTSTPADAQYYSAMKLQLQ